MTIFRCVAWTAMAITGALLWSGNGLHRPAIAQARPPNIVFILADDLGVNDLGVYGRKEHRTPQPRSPGSRGPEVHDRVCRLTDLLAVARGDHDRTCAGAAAPDDVHSRPRRRAVAEAAAPANAPATAARGEHARRAAPSGRLCDGDDWQVAPRRQPASLLRTRGSTSITRARPRPSRATPKQAKASTTSPVRRSSSSTQTRSARSSSTSDTTTRTFRICRPSPN